MLEPTGTQEGKPVYEKPENRKFDRPLYRQYEAAAAIAYAGYRVINNPKLTESDYQTGIDRKADPDHRIEGLVFDCYTPDPPALSRERAIAEERQLTPPESEDPWDWDDRLDWTSIAQRTSELVLDSIRDQIGKKIHKRQAFHIVVNLSDVVGVVTHEDVAKMLASRGVEKLGYVLAVQPTKNSLTKLVLAEYVSRSFSLYKDGPVREFREKYDATITEGRNMQVKEVHSPPEV